MSNMDNYNYFNDPRVINSLISGNAGYGLTHKDGTMHLYIDDCFFEDDERIVLKGSDGKFYEMCLYKFLENPSDDEIIGVLADDQSLEAFHGRFANPEDLKNKHLLEEFFSETLFFTVKVKILAYPLLITTVISVMGKVRW